jgi:uncharacterized protein YkwD
VALLCLAAPSKQDVDRVRSAIKKLHLALPILALTAGLLASTSVAAAAESAADADPLGVLRLPTTSDATSNFPTSSFGLLRALTPSKAAITAEDRIVELVNAERARAGLQPLRRQRQLVAAAGSYATTLADADAFSHVGPDGSRVSDRAEAQGYLGWTFRGENLAAGQDSPERVVQAWMASPTHRANVLASQACDIGVGRATARGARYDNYWVMEIGCGLFSG